MATGSAPIKLGFLLDYGTVGRDPNPPAAQPMELVFREGQDSGLIDRPVQVIYRGVEGLPRGEVKAVVDAFGELVDEGCLAVIGPHISDNAVVVRENIESRFRTRRGLAVG